MLWVCPFPCAFKGFLLRRGLQASFQRSVLRRCFRGHRVLCALRFLLRPVGRRFAPVCRQGLRCSRLSRYVSAGVLRQVFRCLLLVCFGMFRRSGHICIRLLRILLGIAGVRSRLRALVPGLDRGILHRKARFLLIPRVCTFAVRRFGLQAVHCVQALVLWFEGAAWGLLRFLPGCCQQLAIQQKQALSLIPGGGNAAIQTGLNLGQLLRAGLWQQLRTAGKATHHPLGGVKMTEQPVPVPVLSPGQPALADIHQVIPGQHGQGEAGPGGPLLDRDLRVQHQGIAGLKDGFPRGFVRRLSSWFFLLLYNWIPFRFRFRFFFRLCCRIAGFLNRRFHRRRHHRGFCLRLSSRIFLLLDNRFPFRFRFRFRFRFLFRL